MSEHDEQVALFDWVEMNKHRIPELAALYAIPNGGHRHIKVAQKLKAEGVKPGVWDLALDVPSGDWHGWRGEMKWDHNKLTPHQEWRREVYEQYGYKADVAYSWIEQANNILAYLGYDEVVE